MTAFDASAAHAPPGPRAIPLVGNFLRYGLSPLRCAEYCRAEFGPVTRFWLRTPSRRWVGWLLTGPEQAEQVLVERHRRYRKADTYDALRWVVGNGLLTAEGDLWRRQRRAATPVFHRDRLRAMVSVARRHAEAFAAPLGRAPRRVDVHREANTLALQVVCETVFSASIREDMPVIGDHLHVLMQHVVDRAVLPLPWLHELPLPRRQRADRALAGMDAIVDRMVAQSESTGFSGDDLISTFMAVRDDETGAPMSRQQLRDEVLTFLAAGHETTANALAFTLECLARYPAWQEALHEELTGQLGDRPVEFDDLQRLDLLRRVIDESMRLYPPAWSVERSAEEPDEIDGYAIARDDLAIVSMWAIHRHPDHWPDPQRFDPDRFTAQASAGRHRAAYLPFGLGPRMCIGKHFALFELQVILATLLRRVRVSPVSPAPPEVEALVTLRPRGGLPLTLSMR